MNYYAVIDGKAAGPYTAQQLAQIGIKGNNLIWYQGLSNWIPASTVPEVIDLINRAQTASQENTATVKDTSIETIEATTQHETVPQEIQTADYTIQESETIEPALNNEPEVEIAEVQQTSTYIPAKEQELTATESSLDDEYYECPPQHLGLAIFAAIMFPTGIAAIVKTALIKIRWNQGRCDDAIWLAQSARKFSIISIVLGAIFWTLYFMLIISANTL